MKNALLTALALLATATATAGDYAVIVNKGHTAAVDKGTVVAIYTGTTKAWPDGSTVSAADLPEGNPARASFSGDVLGKSVSNIKAIWAQLIFSGKALPPKQMATDDDVKKFVSATPGAIGYIKVSSVDDTIKVALK